MSAWTRYACGSGVRVPALGTARVSPSGIGSGRAGESVESETSRSQAPYAPELNRLAAAIQVAFALVPSSEASIEQVRNDVSASVHRDAEYWQPPMRVKAQASVAEPPARLATRRYSVADRSQSPRHSSSWAKRSASFHEERPSVACEDPGGGASGAGGGSSHAGTRTPPASVARGTTGSSRTPFSFLGWTAFADALQRIKRSAARALPSASP